MKDMKDMKGMKENVSIGPVARLCRAK